MTEIQKESRAVCVDLAGNMFNAASILAATIALLVHLPPWCEVAFPEDGDSDDELIQQIAKTVAEMYDDQQTSSSEIEV